MAACVPSWWIGWCRHPSSGCCRKRCTCVLPSWTDIFTGELMPVGTLRRRKDQRPVYDAKELQVPGKGCSSSMSHFQECWPLLLGQPAEKCPGEMLSHHNHSSKEINQQMVWKSIWSPWWLWRLVLQAHLHNFHSSVLFLVLSSLIWKMKSFTRELNSFQPVVALNHCRRGKRQFS